MSTVTLISRLKSRAKGWGEPDLLKLVQAGQDDLFSNDPIQRTFTGETGKGMPPYLQTTDGVYRYEIKSANLSENITKTIGTVALNLVAYQVLRVFIDAAGTLYGRVPSGLDYPYRYGNHVSQNTERLSIADIPVRSEIATQTTPPILDFYDNPGTTTDKYFVEFTYLPPRLTSTSIPLFVPINFEKALFDYVMGEIQMEENGKMNEYQQRFEGYWKPLFLSKMSQGAQRVSNETLPVEC